jgi:hypothetical protein
MMTLNDDGTATLEFQRPDATTFPVTIRRPTVGQFRRMRTEARDALKVAAQMLAEDRENDEVDDSTMLERYEEAMYEATMRWWKLCLIGDDTFAGMAEPRADIVALGEDNWPSYLIHGGAEHETTGTDGSSLVAKTGTAQELLAHWQRAPLARGARPNLGVN